MKVISLQLVLQTAILATVFSTAGRADGTDRGVFSRGSLQAKMEYCKDCHGLSGQGYLGFLPMPRLAGQTTEYFESQLQAFVARRRERNLFIDIGRVHDVSATMRTALAMHFKDLNPGPFGGGPKRLVAMGKQIFEEGVPETDVPACSACHGPEAKGQEAIPRLAGQLYPYTIKELTNWSKERGQGPGKNDTSAIMEPVAHSLTQSQISALAAYLSYLK
jgi:cytochrome c553